jgi:16S rRNA A1518/A1519 N6-dimethyltransferase RsmA/KsgA/DIM1 with predicted DNA glycosylase/AP lyase activity
VSKKEFFTEFLKPVKNNIGAVAPSSKYLVKKMVDPIDFTKVKCIVEFGPGTGSITLELLNRMPQDAILIVFEINKEFCEKLKEINDSRIRIISDSAENLETYLKKNNIARVDYIVSSLPFSLIPNTIVRNILKIVKRVLNPKGAFIQYQYSLNAYTKLKNTFKKVDLNFTPINLPPAFIFTCTN